MEIPVPESITPTPTQDQNIPIPSKKDFFSSQKKINRSAIFLIIAGIGAMWLTYWWNNNKGGAGYESFPILYYYIFNSCMLFLLGIFLSMKFFRLYSILSIMLGISVTSSLFIFNGMSENPLENIFQNLFVSTTFLGIFFGAIYGGFILVPMFLIGVYKSAIRGFKHLSGRATFNPS